MSEEHSAIFRWNESSLNAALKNTQENNHFRGKMFLNKKTGTRVVKDQIFEYDEIRLKVTYVLIFYHIRFLVFFM